MMAADEAFWLKVLRRDKIPFDVEAARSIVEDEAVLVTGAGGTIGRALVTACLGLGARQVIAIDQSEYALWDLVALTDGSRRVRSVLGSVLDVALLDRVMMMEPRLLLHAAAVKHVGFAERQPAVAARVNIGGAMLLAACDGCAPGTIRKAVLVSTDKAAAPTTIMGMTKRMAEAVWLPWGTRGIVVRPVNVIGSSGSVGETFLARMAKGEPVEAVAANRMFLTAEETAAFIIEAAAAEAPTACVAYPSPAPCSLTMGELAARIGKATGAKPIVAKRVLPVSEKPDEVLRDDSEGLSMPLTDRIAAVANLGDIRFAGEIRRAAEGGNDRVVREMLHEMFSGRIAA